MICQANTRTKLIAAARPKGNGYLPLGQVSDNVELSEPMLNRFDLIFAMTDANDPYQDEAMAAKILTKREQPGLHVLPRAQLLGYLTQGRYLQPKMSNEALRILTHYYDFLKTHGACKRQLTTRQIESLIRVSEAHAKLCHRNKVTKFDAVSTILLLESSCLYNSSTAMDMGIVFADKEIFDDVAEQLLERLDIAEGTQSQPGERDSLGEAQEYDESYDILSQNTVAGSQLRNLPSQSATQIT